MHVVSCAQISISCTNFDGDPGSVLSHLDIAGTISDADEFHLCVSNGTGLIWYKLKMILPYEPPQESCVVGNG